MMMLKTLLFLSLTLVLSYAHADGMDVSSSEPHKVKTLETGAASLQQRLEMIERAQKSIELEFYEFDEGDAPRMIVEALVKKKQENPAVQIRVMIDYFSPSNNLDPYYTTALIKSGVEVKYYNQVFLLNLKSVVHRNHRKHIIVDGNEVVTGGRNMTDAYYDLMEKYNYLDRDIWVQGPIAAVVAQSFDTFWNSKRVKVPKPPKRPPATTSAGPRNTSVPNTRAIRKHEEKLREAAKFASVFDPNDDDDKRLLKLREDLRTVGGKLLATEPTFSVNSIRFIGDGADWLEPNHSITGKVYYQLLDEARESLVIEMPYFYLQNREENFFKRLKEKGIDVDLLLNSHRSSNEFPINHICLLEGLKFSRYGFDLFLFQGDWMTPESLVRPELAETSLWMQHSKSMLRDDDLTWIGSMNMDPRSIQRLNSESAIVVDDKAFNAAVRAHANSRLQASEAVENGRLKKDGSNPAKLKGGLLGLLKKLKTLPFYIFERQI